VAYPESDGYPARDTELIGIYAGDTRHFPPIILDDDELSEWDSWEATWRPSATSAQSVPIDVDTSRLAEGIVLLTASAEATRRMWELRLGQTDTGIWDLQSKKGTEVRTWIWGETSHRGDATR
jgi:hypothetical protein